MRELAEKLRDLERGMADEKGPFALFALFLREDSPNRWDLVVSAPWIEADEDAALGYLAERLRTALSETELVSISHIAPVSSSDPRLEAVRRVLNASHRIVEVRNSEFFGLPIAHAFIITSRKAQSPRTPPRSRRGRRSAAAPRRR
jgi:hypothetical protein